jgi:hypothetical protein
VLRVSVLKSSKMNLRAGQRFAAASGFMSSNENKISDGYRERAQIEVEVYLIIGNVITER